MFCTQCGAHIDRAKFCHHCGEPSVGTLVRPPVPSTEPDMSTTAEHSKLHATCRRCVYDRALALATRYAARTGVLRLTSALRLMLAATPKLPGSRIRTMKLLSRLHLPEATETYAPRLRFSAIESVLSPSFGGSGAALSPSAQQKSLPSALGARIEGPNSLHIRLSRQ